MRNKKIGIYSVRILMFSHVFIKRQIESFASWSPVILGGVIHKDLHVNSAPCYQNRPPGFIGAFKEILLWFSGYSKLLSRAVDKEEVKLIHAHFGISGYAILPFAKKKKIPLIITYHGKDAAVLASKDKVAFFPDAILARRASKLFSYASKIIAVSDHVYSCLELAGAPMHKVVRHYIGVEVELEANNLSRVQGRVLFVGRLTEKKGLGDLVKALVILQPVLSNLELVVIGEGPEKEAIDNIIQKNQLKVFWRGVVSPNEVKQEMERAQLLAVPSFTATNGDQEGLPTVIPEAMSKALPVVGTRHAGIPEIIEDGKNGFLVEERDIFALANAIETIVKNFELGQSLGNQARKDVRKRFDVRKQSQLLEEIYDEVLKEHSQI